MAPRIVGPSESIPGAYDVDDGYGNVFPVDPNTPAAADLVGRYQTEQMAAPVTQGPMFAENDIPYVNVRGVGTNPATQQLTTTDATMNYAAPTAPQAPPERVGYVPDAQMEPGAGGQSEGRQFLDRALAAQGRGGGGGPIRKATLHQEIQAPVDPEIAQRAAEAHAKTVGAVRGTTEANVGLSKAEAEGFRNQRDVLRQMQADDEELAQKQAAAWQRGWDEGDRLRDDVRTFKYDKDQLWKEKGEFRHVVATIGAALGAFGSAVTGRPNAAVDMINAAIDRNMRDQQMDLETKREKLGEHRNFLSDMRARFGDEWSAREAMKIAQKEAVIGQIQAFTGDAATDVAKAQGAELIAKLEQEIADGQLAIAQRQAGTQTIDTIRRTGGGGRKPMSVTDALKVAEYYDKGGGPDKEAQMGARHLSDKLNEEQIPAMQGALNRLNKIAEKNPDDIPGVGFGQKISRAIFGDDVADFFTSEEGLNVRGDYQLVANKMLKSDSGAAVLPPEERRFLEAIQGGKHSYSERQIRQGLKRINSMVQDKVRNLMGGASKQAQRAYRESGGSVELEPDVKRAEEGAPVY